MKNAKKLLAAAWTNDALKDILLWLAGQPPNDDGFITWRGGPLRETFADYSIESSVQLNQNKYYVKIKVRMHRALKQLDVSGWLQRLDVDGKPLSQGKHTAQLNMSANLKKFLSQFNDFLQM
jgi:hypothetical protein